MRIVFMGTPDFAAVSLRRLVEDGHEVCGVFTQPDKPRNRGKVTFSPVKEYALSQNIPVFQPEKMRDGQALSVLQSLAPEIVVVAAYGKILPEEILNLPPYGCINVHASLLPHLRGAAPINWAILNGESETGVTIMHMAKGLDTGDMIRAARTAIAPEEDAASLYDRLAKLGAQTLAETLPMIQSGTAMRVAQDDALSSYAPMLSRELSPIDWNNSAQKIVNQVRGLIPWPCATAVLDGKTAKIYRAQAAEEAPFGSAGTMRAEKNAILVCCGDGCVRISELQPEGGKRMPAAAYLNGRRIAPGSVWKE